MTRSSASLCRLAGIGALAFSMLVFRGIASGMTTQELAEELRKAQLPQADVVAELPGEIEEQTLDFLEGGGTYLKVTLHDPHHPHRLNFVRQGKRLVAIDQGPDAVKEITTRLQVVVRSTDAALHYVQWLLDVTSSGGFWRVASVRDVPFMPADQDEDDLRQEISTQKKDLDAKIQAPHADQAGPVFVVHQDAVAGRDLVRYTVQVSKLGLATIETDTIAEDLPVVYVGSG
jgi:hypothetical protein